MIENQVAVEDRSPQLKYYHRHKEEINRRARNNQLTKERKYVVRYGITMEERDLLLAQQGGVCAICRAKEPRGTGWATDHDHTSGKVRGILCHLCNIGLGHFQDNLEFLRAATAYLEEHSG